MTESSEAAHNKTIPVYIVTGFLGSGKTTLLNHWVNHEAFRDSLVLINEFGSVGLDHELVQSVDDQVVLLENGCICCSLQGALIECLANCLIKSKENRMPKFNRVIIETTGLADPSGVITTLSADDFLVENYCHAGTVAVVDGKFVRSQVKENYEAVKQIALADLILISKTDLIDADELETIREMTAKINKSAPVIPAVNGNVDPNVIERIGPYAADGTVRQHSVSSWLSVSNDFAPAFRPVSVSSQVGVARRQIVAHTNIDSFSLTYEQPIDALALISAISGVIQTFGDSILRIKGILNLKGQDKPVVVHGVQGNLYPLNTLDAWPDGTPRTQLVFIVRESVLEQTKSLFDRMLRNPDQATLEFFREQLRGSYDSEQTAVTDEIIGQS